MKRGMMGKSVILVVGDDRGAAATIGALLAANYHVLERARKGEALALLRTHPIDLVILLGTGVHADDALVMARQIRAVDQNIPIMVVASRASETMLLEMLRSGINDYCQLSMMPLDLTQRIAHCLARSLEIRANNAQRQSYTCTQESEIIGVSAQTRRIRAYVAQVAQSGSPGLITGETGTGKELVAASLHRLSIRHAHTFACFNCAAIPDSLLESELFGHERGAFSGADFRREGLLLSANGGTVFFDEIGDMSLYAQAKILRVLETKQIQRLGARQPLPLNVRVIAATNQELERRIGEGMFRKDLFFRLNVARIHLPPLREHKEDIPPLVTHFIQQLNQSLNGDVEGVTDELVAGFTQYEWPGNVRELKNVLEAMYVTHRAPILSPADLPEQYQACMKHVERSPASERTRVVSVLCATNWNKSKAAESLNWSRMTLYRKMEKYHIASSSDRPLTLTKSSSLEPATS